MHLILYIKYALGDMHLMKSRNSLNACKILII
jgi:hypothetical protein